MKQVYKFNENTTFEIYFGLKRAIYYMEKDIKEWEELNKNGGFQSVIEERQKTIDAIKKLHYIMSGLREMKIVGE